MSKENAERVYAALKNCEPQTPNEIAQDLRLNQKTVQTALMDLARYRPDVRSKKVGRYRLFWKEHLKR
jgi:predicted ArsR family transcriptional regulator